VITVSGSASADGPVGALVTAALLAGWLSAAALRAIIESPFEGLVAACTVLAQTLKLIARQSAVSKTSLVFMVVYLLIQLVIMLLSARLIVPGI
jgi:hypothetical protein